MMTLEEQVCYDLLDFYGGNPRVEIHSCHPPSAKTYIGSLVRIPRLRNGVRTRDRYHVDFIIQVDDLLVLQELKGRASEMQEDIAKLSDILAQHPTSALTALLAKRLERRDLLRQVARAVPAVGYRIEDKPLPEHLVQFIAGPAGVRVVVGRNVDEAAATILREAFGLI